MRRGVQLGATGIETDLRVTADGVVVCAHDAWVGWRRQRVARTRADDLPAWVPSLRELLTDGVLCAVPVSVDLKDAAAVPAMLALARELDVGRRLWCCGTRSDLLAWADAGVGLVLSVPWDQVVLDDLGPAQAVNLHWTQWDLPTVARVRDAGRTALAWGLRGRRDEIRRTLALGVDGLYGDDVGALVRATGEPV
jgi:glycerophosphoryl diester phosphodiesterase